MLMNQQTHSRQNFLTDVIGWDVANWSQALDFWQSHLQISWPSCRALELGCGEYGSLALWLASQNSSVICSSYEAVPEHIKRSHQQYGVADRIAYETIDAQAIPYRATFDLIAFKSMLGAIVREGSISIAKRVLEETYHALKPGGVLLFVENLRATAVHQFARNRAGAGLDQWRYFSIEELKDFCSPYRTVQYTTFGFLGCLGRTEKQRTVLGRIDKALCKNLVPSRWHYIMAGVAIK